MKKKRILALVVAITLSFTGQTAFATDFDAIESADVMEEQVTDDYLPDDFSIEMVDNNIPLAGASLDSGKCGENLTWLLDSEGLLTISGIGRMDSYLSKSAPWQSYKDDIYRVKIDEQVTSIGDCAFSGCSNLIDVTISDGVDDIGNAAFSRCTSLSEISIPGSVTSIWRSVFSDCINLHAIFFKGDWPVIVDQDVLYRTNGITIYYPQDNSTWAHWIDYSYGGRNVTWTSWDPATGMIYDGSTPDPSVSKKFVTETRTPVVYGEENYIAVNYEAINSGNVKDEVSNIIWTSSNPNIAEVIDTSSGYISDVEGNSAYAYLKLATYDVGSVKITGTSGDGRTASVEFDVEPRISISAPSEIESDKTDTATVSVSIPNANSIYLEEYLESLTLYSTSINDSLENEGGIISLGEKKYDFQDDKNASILVELIPETPSGKVSVTVESPSGNKAEATVYIRGESFDTDGDGIPDKWEKNGVRLLDEFIDFPSMGADPNVPDIFVQVDWMEGKAPRKDSLDLVCDQFLRHGINLHIDAGSLSVNYPSNLSKGGNVIPYIDKFDLGKEEDGFWKNWSDLINSDIFPIDRRTTFRHCLFLERFYSNYDKILKDGDRGGIANGMPGQYFIIADGEGKTSSSVYWQATTFMHELGHTLGLLHGGGIDKTNYKPNHISAMNYSFATGLQLIDNDGELFYDVNYSEFNLPDLDEKHLNEKAIIDPNNKITKRKDGLIYKVIYYCKEKDRKGYSGYQEYINQEIDYNHDGKITEDVKADINKDGKYTTLTGSTNEWKILQYKGGNIGLGAAFDQIDRGISYDETTFEEITFEEIEELLEMRNNTGSVDSEKISDTGSKQQDSNYIESLAFKNGLTLDEDGIWRVYKENVFQPDYNGTIEYDGGLFFIANGILCSDANGLNLYDNTWYFLSNGQVQTQYSGFALYDNNWFIIKNGILDTASNGLFEYDGGTFLFAAGKLQKEVSGLWQDFDNTWYFLANGQVQTQYTGLTQYDGEWFYVDKGRLATEYTGVVEYDGAKFNVVAGQVYDQVK